MALFPKRGQPLIPILHVPRRQFVELIDRFPDECAYVIEKLGKVYHHDAIAKEQGLSSEQRLPYHQQHSGSVMAELQAWCKEQIDEKNC